MVLGTYLLFGSLDPQGLGRGSICLGSYCSYELQSILWMVGS